jgi:hypothetical protein
MKKIWLISELLIDACGGSVLKSIIVIFVFYFTANELMGTVEILIFGERFSHWGDPALQIIFIAFYLDVVYVAGMMHAIKFQVKKDKSKKDGDV